MSLLSEVRSRLGASHRQYLSSLLMLIEQSNNARCASRTVIAQMAHCSNLLSKPVLNFYYFEKIHINPNILDYLSFRTCDKCTCILKLLVLRREIVLIFSVGKMV